MMPSSPVGMLIGSFRQTRLMKPDWRGYIRIAARGSVEDLAGVEDAVGVEGAFEGAHDVEAGWPSELRKEVLFWRGRHRVRR